ncbi:MAG TPA: alpha-L-fucosidase [Bacteroidales bacterium]|nr:alpha-L-fucosidase [Bacteroidales bacterium]
MKEKILIGLLFFPLAICGYGQDNQNGKVPLAPKQNRKPEKVQPFCHKYSLEELKDNFSEKMMRHAAKQNETIKETNNKGKWKPTPESIDSHHAPEWFNDAKFGMFIDWGLWSVAGWAPKKEKGAMYPDWYEFRLHADSAFIKYHEKNWGKDFDRDDFISLFKASKYQPQKLAEIAKDAGMKYIVPFSKHHGGFCLWPSSYTQRDAGDMGPKKDLIKPLVESCQKEGLKFGFYFSIEEWEYPLIGTNGELFNRGWGWRGGIKPYTCDLEKKISGKIAVKDYAADYLMPQATEFIDKYDPDLIWYDGDMSSISAVGLRTYDIAAYFYNKAEGRKEVAVNDRYGTQDKKWLRSVRGDFFTNEYGDMEKEAKQTTRAWEACWGISQSFGFNWQDTDANVISSKEFIDKFVDIVAHGGNLLLIVNLDGEGALPQIQEKRLRDIGKWLKVNGEGIYATRPFTRQVDGPVAYTRSKDNQYVYAIVKEWPNQELQFKGLKAETGSKIEMLGYGNPLVWINGQDGVSVKLPDKLQDENNRPCDYAWILKIKLDVSGL